MKKDNYKKIYFTDIVKIIRQNRDKMTDKQAYQLLNLTQKIAIHCIYMQKEDAEVSKHLSIKAIAKMLTGNRNKAVELVNLGVELKLFAKHNDAIKGVQGNGFVSLVGVRGKMEYVYATEFVSTEDFKAIDARINKYYNQEYKELGCKWHQKNIAKMFKPNSKLISKYFKEAYGLELPDTEEALEIALMQLEISNLVLSDKAIDKLIFDRVKVLEILNLKEGKIVVGAKSGRHYHVLSNASKALRSCVLSTDEEKPFVMEIDLKNSQPTLLACLMERHKLPIEKQLREAILAGQFYEVVGTVLGYKKDDITNNHQIRTNVKQSVYRDIFFCQNNAIRLNSRFFKQIKEKYPLFCESVIKLSACKDVTLASKLQNLEAELMLPLVKKYKSAGIHDAILFLSPSKDAKEVKSVINAIKRVFKKEFAITPAMHVDVLSNSKDNTETEEMVIAEAKKVREYAVVETSNEVPEAEVVEIVKPVASVKLSNYIQKKLRNYIEKIKEATSIKFYSLEPQVSLI